MLKQYHVVQMSGYWQFQFDDITIDGKKTGTCGLLPCLGVLAVVFGVQKCCIMKYGVGKCQGVLDTGSSLMPHPKGFVDGQHLGNREPNRFAYFRNQYTP